MRRKLIYFIAFYGLLTVCIFFACRKENTLPSPDKTDPAAPMNVKLAEQYYYNFLMKQPGTTVQAKQSENHISSDANLGEKNYKYLIFERSYEAQTESVTYTEIPLRYNRRPSSVIARDEQSGNYAEKLKILNASFDRLLIYKDKQSHEIGQAVVTFIPDSAYLARHNGDISGNHIDKLDADFNGYLEYSKWDGSSMFLLKITNGKASKTYTYKKKGTNKVKDAQTNAMVCTQMYTQHWVQQCWSTDPEGSNMTCGAWVLESTDYWTECHDDGMGPPLTGNPCIDYGFCGTPTPPPSTPPPLTNSTADHKLPHTNTLPPNHTDDTQVGQLCTFKTLEWVSKYFSGSLTSGQALAYYAQLKGLNITQVMAIINTDGISTADIASLTSHYFNTATSTNLFTSINNGYPIMATILDTGGGGHEVMITGYNNNGTCEYFDPQLGVYNSSKVPSQFYNAIEIHSKK